LELKRLRLRSHACLQALHLLLRASGLSRVDFTGAMDPLVLDPEMHMKRDQLNPIKDVKIR